MKAYPLASIGRPQALPTPKVQQAVVRQVVDLKPAGNTVAIKTRADNPFTDRHVVTVRTQASGGMAKAPTSMQSRRIYHDFMPGLGETATAEVSQASAPSSGSSWLQAGTNLIASARDAITSREARLAQEQVARAEEAKSRAAMASAEADRARADADVALARIRAAVDSTSFNIGGGLRANLPLLLVGGALLGGAWYLSKKNKKGGGARRSRSRRRR